MKSLHNMLSALRSLLNQTGFIAVVGPFGCVLVYRGSGLFSKGGPSEVARLINKTSVLVDETDRCRLESRVVLLGEVDNLSISSPGVQRLSVWNC